MNNSMNIRIGIVTPAYKRYSLLEKYCIYINKLNIFCKQNSIELIPVLVSDDNKIKKIAIKNKIKFLQYKNSPLSKKWNYGVSYFKDKEIDAVIILGSDNFISYQIIEVYKNIILDKNIDIFGFTDIYYWDSIRKKPYYFPGYKDLRRYGEPIGAGRLLKRSALEKMNWKVWTLDKDSGLDRHLHERINKLKIRQSVKSLFKMNQAKEGSGWIIDVKGCGESITEFGALKHSLIPVKNDEKLISWTKVLFGRRNTKN